MSPLFITLAAGEGEHSPLAVVWVEVALALVVFAILFFAIKKFVAPKFEATFAERTQAIEGGLAAAETKQAEADAKLAALEQQLADARHEAARIREEAREQGAQIVAEMREQAQAEASRIVEHGKTQIEAERQQAVTSLRAEVRRSVPSPPVSPAGSWGRASRTTLVRAESWSASWLISRPGPRLRGAAGSTDVALLPWCLGRGRPCADR
jgi:F-type H+-transporting ATPase subunit b